MDGVTVFRFPLTFCPVTSYADVLAAGTAIGYAGEWQAFIKYLQTSYRAADLGQVCLS